jgi:predicted O-methyltransferase YrrM
VTTDRWFQRIRHEFAGYTLPWAGQPDLVYVEIGVWAGASSAWMAEHILTHPGSVAFGIDPYEQRTVRKRHNIEDIKAQSAARLRALMGERYKFLYGRSDVVLPTLSAGLNGRSIDILYIDGVHEGPGVVSDFVLAWPMLRPGSLVVFDDYIPPRGYAWPHVKEACNAIEVAYRRYIEKIGSGRQYALRVVHKDAPNEHKQRFQ